MIDTFRSELRKLLTLRSTYIVSVLSLLLVGGISFYFLGVKSADGAGPTHLEEAILSMSAIVGVFVGIVAILMICHEYRYNTISYTLTMSNSRAKVLLAKLSAVTAYAVVMTLMTLVLTAVLVLLGLQAGGGETGLQVFEVWEMLWRSLAYMIGSVWMGLLFGFLFKSLVFAMAIYFILPTTIEPLLISLLKVNGNYLPNTVHNQVVASSASPDAFSPLTSAGVIGLYLVAGWIAAAILFARRDAN